MVRLWFLESAGSQRMDAAAIRQLNASEDKAQPAISCCGFPLDEIYTALETASCWNDNFFFTFQRAGNESRHFITHPCGLRADTSFEFHLNHFACPDALS